jgi:hypothetical protein
MHFVNRQPAPDFITKDVFDRLTMEFAVTDDFGHIVFSDDEALIMFVDAIIEEYKLG